MATKKTTTTKKKNKTYTTNQSDLVASLAKNMSASQADAQKWYDAILGDKGIYFSLLSASGNQSLPLGALGSLHESKTSGTVPATQVNGNKSYKYSKQVVRFSQSTTLSSALNAKGSTKKTGSTTSSLTPEEYIETEETGEEEDE